MNKAEVWNIDKISKAESNPYYQFKDLINGKLEIYYARKDTGSDYKLAARFKPYDSNQKIIKFNNFDNDKYKEVRKMEGFLDRTLGKFQTSLPLFILAKENKGVVEVAEIEHIYEPEELLDMQKRCYVVLESDSILLKDAENPQIITTLRHQDNIAMIRNALLLNMPFIHMTRKPRCFLAPFKAGDEWSSYERED
jgi:hypothetical protein